MPFAHNSIFGFNNNNNSFNNTKSTIRSFHIHYAFYTHNHVAHECHSHFSALCNRQLSYTQQIGDELTTNSKTTHIMGDVIKLRDWALGKKGPNPYQGWGSTTV